MLLILRQDGAASAWRAAGVRACRAAAHLEEQEVAAGRAEVHGWRRVGLVPQLGRGGRYHEWHASFREGAARPARPLIMRLASFGSDRSSKKRGQHIECHARGCCERDPSEETGAGARLDDPSEDSGRVRRAADGHDAVQLDRRLARPVTWAAERAACSAAAAAADAQVEIRASGRRRLTERGGGRAPTPARARAPAPTRPSPSPTLAHHPQYASSTVCAHLTLAPR